MKRYANVAKDKQSTEHLLGCYRDQLVEETC